MHTQLLHICETHPVREQRALHVQEGLQLRAAVMLVELGHLVDGDDGLPPCVQFLSEYI